MPTENRRVAAYLPKEIDDRFTIFKAERDLGDSQALIVILSEFLGVSQQVAQQSNPLQLELEGRIGAVEEKLAQLKDELLGELRKELLSQLSDFDSQTNAGIRNSSLSELVGESSRNDSVSDQLDLLSEPGDFGGELPSSSKNDLPAAELAPMTGEALSIRFGLGKSSAKEAKRRHRDTPEKFIEWSKTKDPDGIAWTYDDELRKYRPVLSSKASIQVNPLPKGSERSEEG